MRRPSDSSFTIMIQHFSSIILKSAIETPFTEIDGRKVFMMPQNHTGEVVYYESGDHQFPEWFDGLITFVPGFYGIATADCVPVVILFTQNGMPGLCILHAGWRGLGGRIIRQAFEQLEKNFQIEKSMCDVWVGSHICGQCYRIGSSLAESNERIEIFLREFGETSFITKEDQLFLDLLGCVRSECLGVNSMVSEGGLYV